MYTSDLVVANGNGHLLGNLDGVGGGYENVDGRESQFWRLPRQRHVAVGGSKNGKYAKQLRGSNE